MSRPAYRVVFVCLGNICRSPSAEVVFRALLAEEGLAERVAVSSAGTGDWHVGSGIDRRAGAALRASGYDTSRHAARQFDPAWFADADLVVAMDRQNHADLLRLAPTPAAGTKVRLLREYDPDAVAAGDLDVPDPYYEDNFAAVLEIVRRGCAGLLAEVRATLRG